jgi:dienelactone hydrolase
MKLLSLGFVALVALAATACTSPPAPVANSAPTTPAATRAAPAVGIALVTTTAPTAAPPPTATSTPTATPPPTPTLNPLAIQAMRERSYPGSDITLEETLQPGSNYNRYRVSYLSEGLKIYALLTVPRGEKPASGWPVILFNHGYIPPDQYRTTERYVAYVDRLARSGYIVLRSDYRGHDQSEGEARGAYGAPDYTVDVMNALASLEQYPNADPNRIGMWGHSMGGYITLRSMVLTDTIKAGVIWAGVVGPYPNLFQRPTATPTPEGATPEPTPTGTPSFNRRWRAELVETYGTPEENPEFWDSISSPAFVGDISGPIELHHGTADASVPLAASEYLVQALQNAGKPVDLYTYPGDDHNLAQNFGLAMQRTIEFFDKYVKGL